MGDHKDPSVFFLVGALRSGTTVTRLLLGHHSKIAPCNEFHYGVDFISSHTEWPSLDAYYQWLEEQRGFAASGLTIDRDLDYPQLVRSFWHQQRTDSNERLVGATVHSNFDHLPRIWPDAKFIHMLRDPRDVANSCIKMGWAGNLWYGVDQWIDAERTWDRIRGNLRDDQFTELRFELLVEDAERELRRLCDFLGVEYEASMQAIENDTTYARPAKGVAARWRSEVSDFDIRLAEAKLGDLLRARSYATSGLPGLRISLPRRMYLAWQNKSGRLRFDVRRYGLWLAMAARISRRLPFNGWRRRIRLRVNKIQTKYLK